MKRRILVLALVLAATPAARADSPHLKPEAQKHLDAALQAYSTKDFDAAIKEFGLAYAIDPNPHLLYATAQAYRFTNRCTEATDYYRRYLAIQQAAGCAKAPDRAVCEAQIQAANSGISECEAAAKQKAPPPAEPAKPPTIAPPPAPIAPAEPVAPVSTPPTRVDTGTPAESPWYKDRVGGALTVAGIVGVGVGVGFMVMANNREDAAKSEMLRNDFLRDLDDATSQRRIGYIALGTGTALVAGGVWFYLHHDRKPARIVAATDGHSIAIAGRF